MRVLALRGVAGEGLGIEGLGHPATGAVEAILSKLSVASGGAPTGLDLRFAHPPPSRAPNEGSALPKRCERRGLVARILRRALAKRDRQELRFGARLTWTPERRPFRGGFA